MKKGGISGVALALGLGVAGLCGPVGAQVWAGYESGSAQAGGEGSSEAAVYEDALIATQDAFVAVFYHELGHALIDIMQLPVLGLEEDAADILSVVMIHELWDAESADQKLRAAAGFWALSADQWAASGEAPDQWGVHSPDGRRYSTYVCLFYGAAPDEREGLAIELGLPEGRAASCPQEYDLASQSWGPYLDQLYEAGAGQTLVWEGPGDDEDPFIAVIREEVDYLNSVMSLPAPLTVRVARCDEPNAFYDPETVSVTMCAELAEWMLGGPVEQM